ncbi:hypothetical protein LCGC14_1833740 [marine sediment metagenome]|uniref:Uncharacterized protein n=1 Tax=marine sediment metagenome TaxID=412755 RepID=A0A0F9JER9_9ZZZZ
MSLRRLQLDLAVQEDKDGKLPSALEGQWTGLLNHIKAFKNASIKINKGLVNEEDTIRATYHKCFHDEGKQCDTKIEI